MTPLGLALRPYRNQHSSLLLLLLLDAAAVDVMIALMMIASKGARNKREVLDRLYIDLGYALTAKMEDVLAGNNKQLGGPTEGPCRCIAKGTGRVYTGQRAIESSSLSFPSPGAPGAPVGPSGAPLSRKCREGVSTIGQGKPLRSLPLIEGRRTDAAALLQHPKCWRSKRCRYQQDPPGPLPELYTEIPFIT